MKELFCDYCGKSVSKLEKEHVFPKCLYPPSKDHSKISRLTIRACTSCNNGWSDDEAHFRNMLMLSGDPNPSRQELWDTTVMRSFDKEDGFRRMNDLLEKMKLVKVADGSNRYMVYPIEDERVVRVVKKVFRGLCKYHDVLWPISDQQVWVDILKYKIPKDIFDQMEHHHREQDIVEYHYQIIKDNEINSAWLITFFQKITFIGLVSNSENGFE